MDLEKKITGKLSFAVYDKKPTPTSEVAYFCTSDVFNLLYIPFKYDFGPPSIGTIFLFCKVLTAKLQSDGRVCFYVLHDDRKVVTNSICLIGAYCILKLNWTGDATKTFFQKYLPFAIPYRDASQYVVDGYKLGLSSCFSALYKGKLLGWMDLDTFDYEEYSHYERIENGDFNWIIPRKFIASASPSAELRETEDSMSLPTSHYIPYFKEKGVSTVVRLNIVDYDRAEFIQQGFDHFELYFPDGTSPSIEIVHEFLKIAENARGAIMVHCKQGLGRTGTLIACYLVKHYQFSVSESIAYLRLCRPGSVVGQQQHFLDAIEPVLIGLRIEDPVSPLQNQPRHSLRLASKGQNNTNSNACKKSKKPKELTSHQTLMHMTRLRERMANSGQAKIAKVDAKPNALAKSSHNSLSPSAASNLASQALRSKKKIPNGLKTVEVGSLPKRKKADYIQPKMKRVKVTSESFVSKIDESERESENENMACSPEKPDRKSVV